MKDTTPASVYDSSSGQAYLDCRGDDYQFRGEGLVALLVMAAFYSRESEFSRSTDLYCGLLLRKVGTSGNDDAYLKSRFGEKRPTAGGPIDVYERVGAFHMKHLDGDDCELSFSLPPETFVIV